MNRYSAFGSASGSAAGSSGAASASGAAASAAGSSAAASATGASAAGSGAGAGAASALGAGAGLLSATLSATAPMTRIGSAYRASIVPTRVVNGAAMAPMSWAIRTSRGGNVESASTSFEVNDLPAKYPPLTTSFLLVLA